MKKAMYFAVLASVVPLMACGGGGASSSGLIPSGGNSIAVSTGVVALNQAVAGTANSDKLGIKFSGLSLSLNMSTYEIAQEAALVPSSSSASASSYDLTSVKASASLSNASLSFLAEGLTATSGANLKASLTAAADVAYNVDVTKPSTAEFKVSQNQSGVTAAAYLSNGQLYFDASNAALLSLLNGTLGEVASLDGNSFASFGGGKYNIGAIIADSSLPILSEGTITKIRSFGTQMAARINEFSRYFKAAKYDDGSYGLSLSLTKNDLMAVALETYNQEIGSSATSLPKDISAFFSDLTVTSLSAGIVYTESGLKSLTTDVNVSFSGTLGDEIAFTNRDDEISLSTADAAKTVSYGLMVKGTFGILTGSEVTVAIPDLSSYASVNQQE